MNAEQQRIANAGKFSAQANKQFLSEGRELYAWHKKVPAEIQQSMLALIQLHFHKQIEEMEPSIDGYLLLQKQAYLILLDRGVIEFAGPLPAIAQSVLDSWRRESGIGVADLPAPVVVKTPQELLEEQIVNDWNTLPGDQFRAKCNNDRKYRDTFKALSETDAIKVRARSTPNNLEDIVRNDFRTLPTREVRKKCSDNPEYKATLDRLADANAL